MIVVTFCEHVQENIMRIPPHRCNFHNRIAGTGSIEIVVGIIIFVFIVFLFLDLQLLLGGAIVNDSIARDAARAAAMGPPGKLLEGKDRVVAENQSPYLRALATIRNSQTRLLTPFELVKTIKVTETVDPPVPSELFGGPVLGAVTVGTTMIVHPKFILGLLRLDTFRLSSVKTFPYSFVMKSEMDANTGSSHR